MKGHDSMTTVEMPNGSLLGGPPQTFRRLVVGGARVVNPVPRSPQRVPADRKVRVLAVVHGWFPHLAAGSERMMQHLLDALPRAEFDVEVLSFGFGEPDATTETEYTHEGTTVHRGVDPPFAPDLVIVHHEFAARWLHTITGQHPGTAVVVVHHNDRYGIPDMTATGADLHVFNTAWITKSLGLPGIVVHPPLEPQRHRVPETGHKVTLVNLSPDKGVSTFHRLAETMPDVEFLGVTGSHGVQCTEPKFPNVEVVPVTQDMRGVWRESRVVLLPSAYESWGMVATEAAFNGIPVVCSPTPGLTENLGSAGIFLDRDDIDGYTRTVRLLLADEEHYAERSLMARLRGRELVHQTETELRKFVTRVRKLVR